MDPVNEITNVAAVAGLVQIARTAGLSSNLLPTFAVLAGLVVVIIATFPWGGLVLYGIKLGLAATGLITAVVHAGTGSTAGGTNAKT